MRRILLAAALLTAASLAVSGLASAGGNPQNKIALHVVPHGTGCATLPSFATCSDIHTTYAGTGDVDIIPVFFDLAQYSVVEFGLTWPAQWGSIDYVRCAGDIAVGAIVHPGDGIAAAWTQCQSSWSVAHGYGWLAATTPGQVAIVRNPPTGDYGVVDCAPEQQRAYDYPAAVFNASLGGAPGDDPCQLVFLPLALAKSDGLGGHCADPGDGLVYTITYGNTANLLDVHNVVLTDSIPDQVTFASATAGGVCDATARTVTWQLGTLAPDASGSVQLAVSLSPDASGTLVNRCEIAGDETPRGQATMSTLVCTPMLPLRLSKRDQLTGTCVVRGQAMTYKLTYDNTRNSSSAHNVELVDYLPAATSFISANGGGAYNGAAHTVTWWIPTLAAGAQGSRTVTVAVFAAEGSTVSNLCEITSDDTPATSATWNTAVCGGQYLPIGISKTDGISSGCAYQGDTLAYAISYENPPSNPIVHNVTLRDYLPAGVQFISASGGGTHDAMSGTVAWTIGTLAPGESGSRQLVAKLTASPGTTITNTSEIAGDETPHGAASKSTSVCPSQFRQLTLTKAALVGGGCVSYGSNLTYQMTYANPNPIEIHNVTLRDDLPWQTDFVSASGGATYDADTHRVTWALGSLTPGEGGTQEVTIKVNVAQGVTFTNMCAITSDETGPSETSRAVTVCGGSSRNQNHKIAVHVKAHPTSCTKSYPTFTNCSGIKTTYAQCGDLDALPVLYDLAEYTVTEFGLQWPAEWGSCSFMRCKGDIAVGGIAHSGDGIAIAWTACQYGWSVAPGFGWLSATGPGEINICPNPATGDFGVVNCAPEPGPYYDYPCAISGAGVCGAIGVDPCRPTRIEQTSWGAIKAMFK